MSSLNCSLAFEHGTVGVVALLQLGKLLLPLRLLASQEVTDLQLALFLRPSQFGGLLGQPLSFGLLCITRLLERLAVVSVICSICGYNLSFSSRRIAVTSSSVKKRPWGCCRRPRLLILRRL